MPDQDQPGGETKAIAPAPAPAPTPVPETSQPGLSADEERQLGELLARRETAAAASGDTVRLKVEPPHSEMRWGAHVISSEWTSVPVQAESHIMNAAAGAGVTITREG